MNLQIVEINENAVQLIAPIPHLNPSFYYHVIVIGHLNAPESNPGSRLI